MARSFRSQWPNLFPDRVPMIRGPRGHVWFASTATGHVLTLDPASDTVQVAHKGLRRPLGLGFDASGRLYIGVQGARVLRFEPDGNTAPEPFPDSGKPLYDSPNVPIWGLLPDADGGVYVRIVEKGWRKGWPALTFKKLYADGRAKPFLDFGPLFAVRRRFAPWEAAYTLEFDGEGAIVLTAVPPASVLKVRPDGRILWEAGPVPRGGADKIPFSAPRDLAVDSRGDIWVVDSDTNSVYCLSPAGGLLLRHGRRGGVDDRTGNGFDGPTGIAITRRNGAEFLYVGDAGNQRLLKFRIEYRRAAP